MGRHVLVVTLHYPGEEVELVLGNGFQEDSVVRSQVEEGSRLAGRALLVEGSQVTGQQLVE